MSQQLQLELTQDVLRGHVFIALSFEALTHVFHSEPLPHGSLLRLSDHSSDGGTMYLLLIGAIDARPPIFNALYDTFHLSSFER